MISAMASGCRAALPVRWFGTVRLSTLLVTAGLVLLGTACKSTDSGTKPYASVKLPDARPVTIHDAVKEVFAAAGYEETLGKGEWYFDRRGSAMSQFLYGTMFDPGSVVERVKVQLVLQPEGGYLLECRPYIVRDANDPFFEDESKMTRLKSKPYQKLLDKVAKKVAAEN